MVRGFDLGGNDLHRPNTVSHLGACLAKYLGTFLRAFTRVGNDFNRVFRCDGYCHVVTSWSVQFYLLPVPKVLKIKVLRLLNEDNKSNIG